MLPISVGEHLGENKKKYIWKRGAKEINLKKHRGLSPRANYTDRATAACRRR
jgi:hypothetical protein